jgi:YbgC/YbaW family acyl-CoA thioester hydrolase
MTSTGTGFYHVNVRVHWADTDAAGVVWFGNFLRFFEEAEDELFRALGRTRMELTEDFGILMPRVEASCRFRSPARAEEVLEVGIAVDRVSERRIAYRFEARERDTRRPVCEGAYRVACVSQQTFEATELPGPLRQLLARFPDLVKEQGEGRRRRAAGWA